MRTKNVAVLAITMLALAGCSNETSPAPEPASSDAEAPAPLRDSGLNAAPAASGSVPAPCGDGGVSLMDVVGVNGDHDLRAQPNKAASRSRNEKASRALGHDVYDSIDSSTTVRRLCVQPDWTQVQVVTPDWLTERKGWVPNAALREIEKTSDGKRVYVEGDFYWDKAAAKYKPQVLMLVNRISRENTSCKTIDTSSVALSPTRSKPGKPVFFVTCNEGAEAFNVWFEPSDADAGARFSATKPIERGPAALACEAAAKRAATHPSTVDFSHIMDFAFTTHASGRARVVSTFTAKNALNLELKYRISCLFEGDTLIEHTIAEA